MDNLFVFFLNRKFNKFSMMHIDEKGARFIPLGSSGRSSIPAPRSTCRILRIVLFTPHYNQLDEIERLRDWFRSFLFKFSFPSPSRFKSRFHSIWSIWSIWLGFSLGFTVFCWTKPSFTGFYWVWRGFTGFLFGFSFFTGFYLVLPSFT